MMTHRKILKKGNAKLTISNNGEFYVFDLDNPQDKGAAFQTLIEAKRCFCETVDNGGNNYTCYRLSSTAGSGTTDNCDRCWLGWVGI